jgi:hypothetical protein
MKFNEKMISPYKDTTGMEGTQNPQFLDTAHNQNGNHACEPKEVFVPVETHVREEMQRDSTLQVLNNPLFLYI